MASNTTRTTNRKVWNILQNSVVWRVNAAQRGPWQRVQSNICEEDSRIREQNQTVAVVKYIKHRKYLLVKWKIENLAFNNGKKISPTYCDGIPCQTEICLSIQLKSDICLNLCNVTEGTLCPTKIKDFIQCKRNTNVWLDCIYWQEQL